MHLNSSGVRLSKAQNASCFSHSEFPQGTLLLLLLLLSRFSRVRLCVIPQTAAHQALLSLGFSRQEQWSGLPFPSPVHENEVKVKSLSCVRLLATPWTTAYQTPASMGLSRQECWSGVPLPSPRVHCPWATTVGNGLILVEMEQQARFFSTHFQSNSMNEKQ